MRNYFKHNMVVNKIVIFSLAAFSLVSCGSVDHSKEQQTMADSLLRQARGALAAKRYPEARTSILRLRTICPLALDARQAAIFTLDSVELMDARDSLVIMDSLVRAEQKHFAPLQSNHHGRNLQFFEARKRLMQLQSHQDDMAMKVKFYLRKLQEDRK
jgi:hypothetical protein